MVSEEYEKYISKIIESASFGNSTTYANLLRYLVRCTIEEDIPKETTIASEIFGKNDFDPSQSTLVRVYMYNLRKKLDAYYKKEGGRDKKRIRIPKGSYAVEIVDRDKVDPDSIPSIGKKWIIPIIGTLIASLAFNIYSSTNKRDKALVTKDGLWKDLIESERPKMLVLGDLFVYSETDTVIGQTRTIRGPNINSLQEFEEYKLKSARPNLDIEPLTYTHLILGSTQWIKKLSEIFYSIDSDYTIRTMSRFNPKQLQDYDIMVVGMHKTLGVFRSFYKNSVFEYDAENDAFLYQVSDGGQPISYEPNGNADAYHTDYSLMAKVPGPNNNTVYLFSGIWDTGATQSLKNFTDAKLLLELESKLKAEFGTLPKYYEVFFEVNGVDRMELSSKILHMNNLE